MPEHRIRGSYEIDRDRIIHSQTFRELQYKTQVQSLLAASGQAFRTRLNHVLEVAQIARSLARRIGANEALSEAIALAHDLGHPPFGHAGERAIRQALEAAGGPGWNANVHSLDVVDKIEPSFIGFRGLNLTRAVREGIAKHSTPFDEPISFGEFADERRWGGVECQLVDAADVLAYLSHDLDDAIAAGYLKWENVRVLSPILDDLVGLAESEWRRQKLEWRWAEQPRWPDKMRNELVRRAVVARLVDRAVSDLAETSMQRIDSLPDQSPDAVRAALDRVVAFGPEYAELTRALLALLTEGYYRSARIRESDDLAEALISALLDFLASHDRYIPSQFTGENDLDLAATYLASLNDFSLLELARELAAGQDATAALVEVVAQANAWALRPRGSSSAAAGTRPA